EEQKKISNFVRFNYNYNQKYYLTFTTRADASSNFSRDNKWGFFPSAAFKWNLSKENFIQHKDINDLSLRLSAGISGNDAISDRKNRRKYQTSFALIIIIIRSII